MGNDLDEFVSELQEQIYQETKEAYGEEGFERWLNMRYMGRMPDPDGYARLTGTCGDTMEIFLKFEDGRVKEASFLTDGCGSSAVCGSFAAEMAIGKTPDELLEITGEAILEKLGGLPKEEEHCAYLAGETMQEALNDYMAKQVKQSEGD
ncbi:MAG: iron-sulfur cluster assembly scaffold protein [Deltaproteobacteria bacterium]|nr:MAG: iron-sulfur cluster assembly scaffold protein [Deltaproteobacteria bacterium]